MLPVNSTLINDFYGRATKLHLYFLFKDAFLCVEVYISELELRNCSN